MKATRLVTWVLLLPAERGVLERSEDQGSTWQPVVRKRTAGAVLWTDIEVDQVITPEYRWADV